MMDYSETEIIAKILSGEAYLFEKLIRKNNPYLYKVGRSYGYKHEDVEDLMQEAFITAYLGLSKFENRSSFRTWIIRIMLNLCYHKRQKASFKNEIVPEQDFTDKSKPMFANNNYSNTDKTILNRELNHVLETVLEEVPVSYKIVFSLREISGLNISETAEALDITEANVKVRLNRAKKIIREKIEKIYSTQDIYDFNLKYCDKMVEEVMTAVLSFQLAKK
jgi:RNA polymerase sigma factor (sigma-70 family)